MDDFISKPIELKKLKTVMGKWAPLSNASLDLADEPSMPISENEIESHEPINYATLVKYSGNKPDFHKSLFETFITENKNFIDMIDHALHSQDLNFIREICHKKKSSAKAIGAEVLSDHLSYVEHAIKSDATKGIYTLINNLKAEYDLVRSFIINNIL
jgi:HPt (histidine-containing phosphotransfer) domain-containing protein